jgi:hypothetical protein
MSDAPSFRELGDKVREAVRPAPEPVDYVLWVTPFLIFITGDALFLQFPIPPGFCLTLYYLSIIVFELIHAYQEINAFSLGKIDAALQGRSAALRAWLNPAVHRALIAVIFLALGLGFRLHILAYILYTLLPIATVLRNEVGPRVPQLRDLFDQLADALEHKVNFAPILAILEIALAPWLLLLALGTFSGNHFLAFLLYIPLMSLYGEIVLPKHREVYHKAGSALAAIVPGLEEKLREPLGQVRQIGETIYPRGALEKIKD